MAMPQVEAKFEVGVYNQEVRRLVEDCERHAELEDAWADMHYIEVTAESKQDAKAIIARRYPAHQGYVINDVIALDDYG